MCSETRWPSSPHKALAQSSLSTVALGPWSPPGGREHQMQGPPGPKGSAPGGERDSGCQVSLQERQTCREGSVKMVQGQRPEGCGHRPAVLGQSPEARRGKEGSEGAWCCRHLDFGPLASRTGREYISAVCGTGPFLSRVLQHKPFLP